MATVLPTAEPFPASYVAPAPAAAGAPPAVTCANCGWTPCGDYCPRCGQETHDLHRSLAGILGELLDAFAGWDGKIPTTLWLMVRYPGALTREFLAGRRVRYLRPLRIYLTMSVAFFLSLNLVHRADAPPDPLSRLAKSAAAARRDSIAAHGASGFAIGTSRDLRAVVDASRDSSGVVIRSDSSFDAFLERHRHEKGHSPAAWLKRNLTGGLARLKAMPKAQRGQVIKDGFFAKAPNMIFLLLPVFALLLRLLYLRTPVYYAEHFVFALHNHAFAYLALTLAHVASVWLHDTRLSWLAALPVLWMPVYFFVAMRRVYGGSRVRTALKFAALSTTYGTILLAGTVVTMLLAVFALA